MIAQEINVAQLSQANQRIVLPPFYADTAVPLSLALNANQIKPDTPLFSAELEHGRVISLIAQQMGVHPVAQGILRDQPWLITF